MISPIGTAWRSARRLWRRPHTPKVLDRLELYPELTPNTAGMLVTLPGVATFVLVLVPAQIVAYARAGVFDPGGATVALVIAAAIAFAVWWTAADLLDRWIQVPIAEMPALPSGERLALRWADARCIDRDAYLETMEGDVPATMGWTEHDLLVKRWITLAPKVALMQREIAFIEAATETVIGGGGYGVDPREPEARSIGCWISVDHRGKGYGAEAVGLLVSSAPRVFDGPTSLLTAVDNLAMRRIAEGAGGHEVERFDHELPDGAVIAAVRYRFGPGPAPAAAAGDPPPS